MPEHVHIFLVASPDDAPSSIANLCGTYLHILSEAERTQVLGYGRVDAIAEVQVQSQRRA